MAERGLPSGLPARAPDRQDGAQPDHRAPTARSREYAQLVADELGVPALDVKVVPADTDRFGVGHGYNTSPVGGRAGGDRQRDGEDPRQGAAARRAWRSTPRPTRSTWSNGAWVGGDGSDPTQVETIADLALYAHGTGALPPGRRGRPRRAGRLPRLRQRRPASPSSATLTSSATLSAPNSAE